MANTSITAEETSETSSGFSKVSATIIGSKKALDVSAYASSQSIRIDEVSSTLMYIGKASAGVLDSEAQWKIKKMVTSGTVTSIVFADGDSNYDNVWDDRASLTYI